MSPNARKKKKKGSSFKFTDNFPYGGFTFTIYTSLAVNDSKAKDIPQFLSRTFKARYQYIIDSSQNWGDSDYANIIRTFDDREKGGMNLKKKRESRHGSIQKEKV
eukprot:TRINITY_DN3483_c0_g2_i3.p1 TRINITY_DN3483_c0_g2~~TRINITY_DN3483_c0_g2_i3.p1  ORF type:complete len:105 (-),score=17.47 TRINITY_DN3483_c0_g2_i3:380-694(-)